MLARLKSENFTLAIGEPFDMCFFGITSLLGIDNYITLFAGSNGIGQFGGYFGIPSTPSFVGGMMSGPPPFSYFERAKNLIGQLMAAYFFPKTFVEPINEVLRPKLGQDFDAIVRMLLNINPSFNDLKNVFSYGNGCFRAPLDSCRFSKISSENLIFSNLFNPA